MIRSRIEPQAYVCLDLPGGEDDSSFHTRKIICRSGGLKFAVASFDAGVAPASPLPLRQPLRVTQIAGGCGPGWHLSPYGAAAGGIGDPPGHRRWFRPTPYGPRRVRRW
jgi:hypothetical protein